ncbi:hypothetical protein MferCBS31731_003606 [Microsporum ferrugineum]
MASSNIAICVPAYPAGENSDDVDMTSDSELFTSDDEMSNNDKNTPTQEACANGKLVVIDSVIAGLEKKSKEGLQVLKKLETILKKFPSPTGTNAALDRQVSETLELGKNKPSVVIGVVGATGAGKSSVINALLGEERLVPTSGMRACTASITEISYNNGSWKYEAEIQFVSRSSWKDEMRLLFEDMRDGFDQATCNDDSDFGIACAKFKAVYKLPLQNIRTISLEDLMENQDVTNVLGSTKYLSGDDANQFYKDLRKYVDSEASTQTLDQDNMRTDPTQDISENKPMGLWPLVELVRLRVKAPVLSTGVVIVDLPGLLDVNTARATLAQKYIQNCSGLWVVAPITRAVDDHSARTLLGDGFKRQLQLDGGIGQIAFICSKIDDINLSEAADDPQLKKAQGALEMFQEERKKDKQDLRAKIKLIKQKAKRLNLKIYKLIDDLASLGDNTLTASGEQSNDTQTADSDEPIIQHASGSCSKDVTMSPSPLKHKILTSKKKLIEEQIKVHTQLQSLQKRLHAQDIQLEKKKHEFQLLCIEKRNEFSKSRIKEDFVTGLLQPKDTNQPEDGPDSLGEDNGSSIIKDNLHVFCVSSKAFQVLEGRFKGDNVAKGFLTTEDTGIPQLQRHCLNLGAKATTLHHNNFLNNLGQLVNSLKLQASRKDGLELQKKQDYDRESLDIKLNTLGNSIHTIILELSMDQLKVRQELYDKLDRASVAGTTAAEEAPLRWHKEKKMGGIQCITYRAICRRSGEFRNGNGKHDWNKELADPMMAIVGLAWESVFINQIPALLNSASNALRQSLSEFHRDVMRSVETFTGNDSRSRIFKDQSLRYQEKTKQTFRFVYEKIDSKQRDLNRVFIPTIAQALKPAYNTVYGFRGAGSFQRMKDTITSHVAELKYHMFQKAVETVKDELEDLANVLEDVLRREIEKIFDDMSHDYMTGLKNSSEMEKPLKEEILSFLNSTSLFGEPAKFKEVPSTDNQADDTKLEFNPIVTTTIGSAEIKFEPGDPDNV